MDNGNSGPLAGGGDLEALAHAMALSYLERPRFASLVSVTTSVLERNITVDAVVWFKTEMFELAIRVGNAVHAVVPSMDMDRTQQFLKYGLVLVVGLWPAAHPPPAVEEALRRPELQYACVDLERDLELAILTLLRGLRADD